MMRLVRVLVIAAAGALMLPGAAGAFRNVAVGSAVPALALDAEGGTRVAVPAAGRVTVVLFWRPGQVFSQDAVADLGALMPALRGKGVSLVAIAETGSDTSQAAKPAFDTITDRERRAADAFGVIVFPSTAVVDTGGVLRAYVPSRNSNYRAMVEAHVLRAAGEIPDAELTARLARMGEVYGKNAEAAHEAYQRGVAFAADKRLEEAAHAFAQALAIWPAHTETHLQLGYVRLEMNEPAQALREFESVLAKTPASPGARVGVGISRIRLGQPDEGIRLLEDAVVLNPEPVRGHYELGRAYEARGDTGRAIYHYRWAFLKLLQGRK